MKVVTSLVVGILFASLTAYNVQQAIQPWAPKVIDMCFNHHGDVRTSFIGVSKRLDEMICFYVKFNQQVFHDIIGIPLKRVLMATFATVYALMAFESSRKGYKKSSVLIAFPILGLLANIIGMSIVFPVIWVPLYFYYNRTRSGEDFSVSMSEVYGILIGILFGYGLPSALISTTLIPNDSVLEQEMLCIWQVLPIIITPLFGYGERLFKKIGSSVDSIKQTDLKKRLIDVQGKDALERTYLFLGILNMIIYYGSYLTVAHQGVQVWDSLILLLNAPGTLPAGLNFTELGQLLVTRTVLVECISLSISFAIWATFNSGILIGFLFAIATPIIGPGAALSFYSYYREGQIHNK